MAVDLNQLAAILDNFLDGEKSTVDFAWTRKIDNRPILKSFIVEGLGEIAVPVSEQDLLRLKSIAKRAPFGNGTNIVVDTSVREAWQIDALKISASPQPPDAFGVTVPKLVSLSLAALGLEVDAIGVEIHLYSMLLYEAGGHFVKHRGSEKEPGMFASLILQIPVEGGHQGGIHDVEFDGRMTSFDSSIDSDRSFHSTIFLVNCQRELERITSGWRLEFVFNLVWKRSIPIGVPPNRLPDFLRTVKNVQTLLNPWLKQDSPRLLAIPLNHKYSRETLLFAGLRESDRMIFDTFNAIGTVQIHLAILTKHQTGSALDGPPAKRRRLSQSSPPPNEDFRIMEHVHNEEFETTHWRKVDGRPVKFFQLEIDWSTELVGNIEDIFPSDAEPDQEEYGVYYSRTGTQPKLDHWFHQSVLVIWPKQRSIRMACEYGFDGALELIERTLQASERNKEHCLSQLREVINFCKSKPEKVWIDQRDPYMPRTEGPGIRVRRMMKLCTRLKAIEEGLVILNLISTDFPKNETHNSVPFGHYLNRPPQNPTFYEGIQSDGAAEAIAEFIRLAGWDRCSTYLDQLVCCSHATYQIAGFANLATHLLNFDCIPAATAIANKTTDFLFADEGSLFRQLDLASVVCCVLMAMFMEAKNESKDPGRVSMFAEYAGVLELKTLSQLIVYIWQKHGSVVKKSPASVSLFKDLCINLLNRDIHSVAHSLSHSIVEIMNLILSLQDSSILQKFVAKICATPNTIGKENNLLLETLSNCRPLRNTCVATADGKRAICDLVTARIAELEALEEPVFSWAQPNAVFAPEHPAVEAFLRSTNESMVYASQFNGVQHARNFAERYFNGNSLTHGYSADTEVSGVGKASKCKIIKNRRLYDHTVELYDLRRTELVKLQSFISRQCQVAPLCNDAPADQTTDSVSVVAVDVPHSTEFTPDLVPVNLKFYNSADHANSSDQSSLQEISDSIEVNPEPIESMDADGGTKPKMNDDDLGPETASNGLILEEASSNEISENGEVTVEIDQKDSVETVISVTDQEDQRSPNQRNNETPESRDGHEEPSASEQAVESTDVPCSAADLSSESIGSSGSLCVVVEPVTDTVNGILLDGDIPTISEVKEAIA